MLPEKSVLVNRFISNLLFDSTLRLHLFTRSDEDKLKWAFRLYDMDNNGVIDIEEMAAIIETLDCIEGVKPGCLNVPCHVKDQRKIKGHEGNNKSQV